MNVDWLFVFMVFLPCCAAWCLVGWELCHITHKQRGIEVDRPVTDIIPMPPPPVIVPDTVPIDWVDIPKTGMRERL